MPEQPRSKAALWLGGIYLVIGLAAWILPLVAKPGESLAGVYLVLVAQPWASLLVWIMDRFDIDSFAFNMVFMLLGVLLNTWIIYRLLAWLTRSRRG